MPNPLPHTAKSIFFCCIDDRLSQASLERIAQLEGGAFHSSIAGGGLAFLSAEDRTTALKQVVAAYKINGITDVYLQSHTDCGAYRLSGITFTDTTAELSRLDSDLGQASQIISQALTEAGATHVQIYTEVVDPSGKTLVIA